MVLVMRLLSVLLLRPGARRPVKAGRGTLLELARPLIHITLPLKKASHRYSLGGKYAGHHGR